MWVHVLALPRHGWWPLANGEDEVEQLWLDWSISTVTIIMAVTTIITIDAGPPSSGRGCPFSRALGMTFDGSGQCSDAKRENIFLFSARCCSMVRGNDHELLHRRG